VKELKDLLRAKSIDFSDCFEKGDLVRRILSSRALPMAEIVKTFQSHLGPIVGMDLVNNLVGSGARDGYIHIKNLESDVTTTLKGHSDAVNVVQFFGSCSKVISAANDSLIKVWDVNTTKTIKSMSGHLAWVWGLKYDEPSNTVVSCSVDGTVRIWDFNSGKEVASLPNPTGREVSGVDVDFLANRIVSNSFDGHARLWDMRTRKLVTTLKGHKDRGTRICLNEDKVLTASFDTDVRQWSFV